MSFGALHVARTGLDAQGFRMQVIANNLANVNTTGFKRDRANFETLGYQIMTQAGAPSSAISRRRLERYGISCFLRLTMPGRSKISSCSTWVIGAYTRVPDSRRHTRNQPWWCMSSSRRVLALSSPPQ